MAQIGEEQMTLLPGWSVAEALQGKLAGVDVVSGIGGPGGTSSIRVRGASQMLANQHPLIILDGMILDSHLADIHVHDVASIHVVKGAPASAIYGPKAGHGAIVITTKSGGEAKERPFLITLRNEFGRNQLSRPLELNQSHAFALANDWQANTRYTSDAIVNHPDGYSYGTGFSGSRAIKEDAYMDHPYARIYHHQDEVFAGNYFFSNYVSLSGSQGRTSLLASFEQFHDGGLLYAIRGFDRSSFRVNVAHQFSDRLALQINQLYVRSSTQRAADGNQQDGQVFSAPLLLAPDVDLWQENPDGQPHLIYPDPWNPHLMNPLYSLQNRQNDHDRNRIIGSTNLTYDLSENLQLGGNYAYEHVGGDITWYDASNPHWLSSGETGFSWSGQQRFHDKQFRQTMQVGLTYQKIIDDLRARAKLSYLYEDFRYDRYGARASNFIMKHMPYNGTIYDGYGLTGHNRQTIRSDNLVGMVSMIYRDRYMFDGSIGRDGSSMFEKNDRYHTNYRVAAAWRVSHDLDIPGIDELTVRSAYGVAGQRPSLFPDQYGGLGLVGTSPPIMIQQPYNQLKPSTISEVEAGITIDFLSRFRFEAVYSHAETTDQLMVIPPSSSQGIWMHVWQNAGTLETHVVEASLMANMVNSQVFSWDMGLHFDRVRTEISHLDVPPFLTGPYRQGNRQVFYIGQGESPGAMYGYSWVRSLRQMAQQLPDGASINDYVLNSDGFVIPKGAEGTINEIPIKVKDENGDDLYSRIGSAMPDFTMGLSSFMNYSGIGLYMLWTWRQGGDVYNQTAQWLTRDGRHHLMDQAGKAANEKKTLYYYQSFYDNNQVNSFWVADASFLKLREIALYYDLPHQIISGFARGAFSGIRVGMAGRNLFTVSPYTGYDPEVMTPGLTQYYAYDSMGYPAYRSFSGTLTLKF